MKNSTYCWDRDPLCVCIQLREPLSLQRSIPPTPPPLKIFSKQDPLSPLEECLMPSDSHGQHWRWDTCCTKGAEVSNKLGQSPPTHKNSFIWHPGRQTKTDFVSVSRPWLNTWASFFTPLLTTSASSSSSSFCHLNSRAGEHVCRRDPH